MTVRQLRALLSKLPATAGVYIQSPEIQELYSIEDVSFVNETGTVVIFPTSWTLVKEP